MFSGEGRRQLVGAIVVTLLIVGVQYGCLRVLLPSPPVGGNWFTSNQAVALVWLALVSLVVIPLAHRLFGSPYWFGWAAVTLALELFTAYLAYMRFPNAWGDARIAAEAIPVFACFILGQREARAAVHTAPSAVARRDVLEGEADDSRGSRTTS